MPDFIHTKVDPNRLNSTAANIDNGIRSLTSAFKTIDDALHGTLYPTWEGPAREFFFAQYSQDVQVLVAQLQSLQAFNDQLKQASGTFDSADQKALELVNQLQIGV